LTVRVYVVYVIHSDSRKLLCKPTEIVWRGVYSRRLAAPPIPKPVPLTLGEENSRTVQDSRNNISFSAQRQAMPSRAQRYSSCRVASHPNLSLDSFYIEAAKEGKEGNDADSTPRKRGSSEPSEICTMGPSTPALPSEAGCLGLGMAGRTCNVCRLEAQIVAAGEKHWQARDASRCTK
jgi:hypothetical protein